MDLEVLARLNETIAQRRKSSTEGSYTSYLFEKGLDKILKKIGEESSELIIASKNGIREEIVLESCDLLFHLLVLLNQTGVGLEEITAELEAREAKTGNLKTFKSVDKNT